MRGIVYSLVFMACVAVVAGLLLLSFNGCGEVDGEAAMHEIYAERLACERIFADPRTCR